MTFVQKRFTNGCDVTVKAFSNGYIRIDMGFMVWECNSYTVRDVNNDEIKEWVKSVYKKNPTN